MCVCLGVWGDIVLFVCLCSVHVSANGCVCAMSCLCVCVHMLYV